MMVKGRNVWVGVQHNICASLHLLVKWSHELQSKRLEEALFMVGPFAWLECLRKKLAYNFSSQYAVPSKAKFFLELMLYSF